MSRGDSMTISHMCPSVHVDTKKFTFLEPTLNCSWLFLIDWFFIPRVGLFVLKEGSFKKSFLLENDISKDAQ